ncbi:MAG: hypothetical protein GY850_30155, partial [bacterium]|nr:hypothetical protein [bacterium]
RQTSDGRNITTAKTNSSGAGLLAFLVMKLNSSREIEWQITSGVGGHDEPYDIIQTGDGGYLVVGKTNTFGSADFDALILKLDADGDFISSSKYVWQNVYGGSGNDIAYSVSEMQNGSFIIAGVTNSFGSRSDDAWILHLNYDGTIRVNGQKTYGSNIYGNTNYSDSFKKVASTSPHGAVVAGKTFFPNDTYSNNGYETANIWVVKLDYNGNSEWQKMFGVNSAGEDIDIQQASDGGYIVAGSADSASRYWVMKLDSNGNHSWSYKYGSGTNAFAAAIAEINGGYLVAGTAFIDYSYNIRLIQLDNSGTPLKTLTYGSIHNDMAGSLIRTDDNEFLLSATSNSYSAGESDLWLLKLNNSAELTSCDLTLADNASQEFFCVPLSTNSSCSTFSKIAMGSEERLEGESNAIVFSASLTPQTVTGFSTQDICILVDSDGDKINDDVDNCPDVYNPDQANCDADKDCPMIGDIDDEIIPVGDACDTDYDNDGILDDGDNSSKADDNLCTGGNTENCDDNCPSNSNKYQLDYDGDGVGYACDNCPGKSNPDQANSDQDELGDACDDYPDDSDDDNSTDAVDNCLFVWNPTQTDSDNDSVGNACDNCPDLANASQLDTDKDGWGDV